MNRMIFILVIAFLLAPMAYADEAADKALLEAASSGNKAMVEELLSKGANVNAKDADGNTALHSLSYSNIETVKLLIAKGANVNARNAYGKTPLHVAAALPWYIMGNGYIQISALLIANGADVNAADEEGNTPLFSAVYLGSLASIKLLLAHGANIHGENKRGNNVLTNTVMRPLWGKEYVKDYLEVIDVLLAHGVNAGKDKNGNSLIDSMGHNSEQRKLLGPQIADQVIAHINAAAEKQAASKAVSESASPRMAFEKLVAEFKGHANDETLRGSIFELAQKIKPAPAAPPEAEAADGRAQYLFKNAKSEEDYLGVAKQYLQAIEAAPWVPIYYYNLCVVLEKTVYTKQALHACRLYLKSAPTASPEDATRIRTLIAGQEFALQNTVEKMKQRIDYSNGFKKDDLYHRGGITTTLSGKEMALKIAVDWQAAPPKYQVLISCYDGDDIYLSTYDLLNTDRWITVCHSNIGMHLVIKPEGEGFVELSESGGSGRLRATLDQLFIARLNGLDQSPLFNMIDNDTQKYRSYVAIGQGGNSDLHSGLALHETDCTGHLLRKDPRALPTDFLTQKYMKSGAVRRYFPDNAAAMENLDACGQSFQRATGYAMWGYDER